MKKEKVDRGCIAEEVERILKNGPGGGWCGKREEGKKGKSGGGNGNPGKIKKSHQ